MDWKIKTLLHWTMSYMPFGEAAHYWFQTLVTKGIPMRENRFQNKIKVTQKHMENFHSYATSELDQAIFFEFGTGWDLPVQLLLYAYGVNKQITVDVKRLLRTSLINNSVSRIKRLDLSGIKRLPEQYIGKDMNRDLSAFYGIHYLAPGDATKTDLSPGSIDFITSTDTMQHIPAGIVRSIVAECHRILVAGGVMSVQIGHEDHYSFFDRSLPRFNFLKYSDEIWSFFCPPSHYQNRLRHIDYRKIFSAAGFEILEENKLDGTKEDLEFVRNCTIDKKFTNGYSPEDLVVRLSHFALRKQ